MIDTTDGSNLLNPTKLEVSAPGTDGIYSQNQLPFRENFFNTGRNVFQAFDLLYDAENGYMGVRPTAYGTTLVGSTVFFTAQAGGLPNPIPEPGAMALVLRGSLLLPPRPGEIRRARRRRRPGQGP